MSCLFLTCICLYIYTHIYVYTHIFKYIHTYYTYLTDKIKQTYDIKPKIKNGNKTYDYLVML